MPQIQLQTLTDNRVRSLSGQERGVAARAHFKVDELDVIAEPVVVHVPDNIDSLAPSFLQGMFSLSIRRLGRERFLEHYVFDASPVIIEQVNRAIRNSLIDRENLLS